MEDIKQFKKTLGLKVNNDEFTNVMAMIDSNSKLAGEVGDGYFIARQKFSILNNRVFRKESLQFRARILKKREMDGTTYISCKSEVIFQGKIQSELSTYLVRKEHSIGQINERVDCSEDEEIKNFISFTPEQIKEFSMWCGDPNSIHYGDKPIVQGMLILLTLEDYLNLNNIKVNKGDIKYLKPIKAYEDIFISHKNNSIIGVVNNIKCFVLNYEEDKK